MSGLGGGGLEVGEDDIVECGEEALDGADAVVV